MTRYSLVFGFDAKDIREAEDVTAAMLDHVGRRAALYYDDPISGDMKLWAEPAMNSAALRAHRALS